MIANKSAYCVTISGDILTISTRGKIEKFDGNGVFDLSGRGEITAFSRSSRYRMCRFLRETETEYRTFITLTYPGEIGKNDDRASKNDLRTFIQRLRRNVLLRNDGRFFSVFWFLEFQDRGAIHYHLFCTHGFDIEFLRSAWADCVVRRFESGKSKGFKSTWIAAYNSGSRIESIRSGREGIQAYAAKYASKFDQKLIPTDFFTKGVGRFWGVCGRGKVLSAATRVMEDTKTAKISVFLMGLWEKSLKGLFFSGAAVDLTEKIPDLPAGMHVFKLINRNDARKIEDFLKKWEVVNAILEGRGYCLRMNDEDIEKHYRELMNKNYMKSWVGSW